MSADWHEKWAPAAQRVANADTVDFAELIRLGSLDPQRHLRFADWSNIDFTNCDLRGFDFAGSSVENANFTRALIAEACFDKARTGGANLRAAADWMNYLATWRPPKAPLQDTHLRVGAVFQDAPFAPELVVVPSGRFVMGSPADEEGRFDGEGPLHEVSIPKRLAVGRYPITFEEWDFASRQGMKKHQPDDRGWGRDRRPVINVSWEDAQAYIAWLRRKTGHDYRLLSEAEWEYCCRAGSARRYSFGDEAERLAEYAWYNRNSGNQTHPVGEKKPNAWGLCDMHGNVWEWCEDMWHDSYKGKPAELNETGAAWTTGDGSVRVLRGGSSCRGHAFSVTLNSPQFLRSAIRIRNSPDYRSYDLGFRVARTLTS